MFTVFGAVEWIAAGWREHLSGRRTAPVMARWRPSARLFGQFIDDGFQLAVNFRQLRMENLFGREQGLQIRDEKGQTRIVKRRQFFVEFGVENGKRPFGLLQLLLGPADFRFFSLLGALQSLETVSLSVIVYQLPSSLFDFFLFGQEKIAFIYFYSFQKWIRIFKIALTLISGNCPW